MIIDVRNRPPIPEFAPFFSKEITRWVTGRLGVEMPEPFETGNVDDWAAEVRNSMIDKAMVVSRNTPSCIVPNSVLADLREKYPDIVVPVAGIDIAGAIHDPVAELEYCVNTLNIYAAAIDPGTSGGSQAQVWGSRMDAGRFFAFYQACSDLEIPLFMMTGPFAGRDYSYSDPVGLDRIAVEFPSLTVIAGHGCYPFVTEVLAVGYKRENVYVSPDVYMFSPGATPYVEAAEGILRRQMLFGTAYPFGPVRLADETEKFGLSSEAYAAYMGGNAERVFARALAA